MHGRVVGRPTRLRCGVVTVDGGGVVVEETDVLLRRFAVVEETALLASKSVVRHHPAPRGSRGEQG